MSQLGFLIILGLVCSPQCYSHQGGHEQTAEQTVLTATNEVDSSKSTMLVISQVNMPAIPPVSRTAAIYLNIENIGDKDVEFVGVSTDAAHHAMLHQSIETEGVAKMHHLENMTIAAKSSLELKPNSYHIMLMGLDREKLNQSFELTLQFNNHADVTVIVNP